MAGTKYGFGLPRQFLGVLVDRWCGPRRRAGGDAVTGVALALGGGAAGVSEGELGLAPPATLVVEAPVVSAELLSGSVAEKGVL